MQKTNRGQTWGNHSRARYPSEYYAWTNMKTRCYNPKYHLWKDYGERGIRVAQPWVESFEAFLADVGPKPYRAAVLDRIDCDGHYSPENVRWADPIQSARNKRSVKQFMICGETKTLPEWEKVSPVGRKVIWRRLKDGWSPEAAIFADPQPTRRFDRNADFAIEREYLGSGLWRYRMVGQ